MAPEIAAWFCSHCMTRLLAQGYFAAGDDAVILILRSDCNGCRAFDKSRWRSGDMNITLRGRTMISRRCRFADYLLMLISLLFEGGCRLLC